MDRKQYRALVAANKHEAKAKNAEYKQRIKDAGNISSDEKTAEKQRIAAEKREWKASIKATSDKQQRKAEKKGWKRYRKIRRRPYVIGAIVLVIALIGGGFTNWYVTATKPLNDQQQAAADSSRTVAEQVMDESITLLKNNNDVLPFSPDTKLNVFGSGAAKPLFGGGGAGGINITTVDDLFAAFDDNNIAYNPELFNLYNNYVAKGEASTADYERPKAGLVEKLVPNLVGFLGGGSAEMPPSNLSDAIMDEAANYSDTAVYVVSRTGSETIDLTPDQMSLSDDERGTIELLDKTFAHVVVLVNSSNTLELGFLDELTNVEGALWVGLPGQYGTHAIARALIGETNPSGRLVDTWAYDVESNPAVANTGNFQYLDANGEPMERFFTNNLEGIYVGYRYYETFLSPDDYATTVQYPFGYGLSYTNFAWDVAEPVVSDDSIAVKVTVTNTGETAGKDVVELYYSAPYTAGGIEKSAIELGSYAKTKQLKPGESQDLTLELSQMTMASYDETTAQAWVLEAGDYGIKLGTDVHTIRDTFTYTVPTSLTFATDDATGAKITNQFSDAAGDLTYLSRSNPSDTMPVAPTDEQLKAPKAVLDTLTYEDSKTTAKEPTLGAKNDLQLKDLEGLSYDDPKWEQFLDQFTEADLVKLAGDGGYWSSAISHLGIPETTMYDGPASIRSFLGAWSTVAYPVSVNAASTWNDELIEQMGHAMGEEAQSFGVDAVYAPSVNMHRSPLGGRNFEYYSEDPLISGKMAAAYTRGIQETGTTAVVKHFAANDQETNRANNGLYVWATEQSLREIYLKPFEITVKESNPHAMMSAFNRIGTTWAGGSHELLTDVLRDEWGFEGFVITDAGIAGQEKHFNAVQAVKAGNDLMLRSLINLPTDNLFEKELKAGLKEDRAGLLQALRTSAHNISFYVLTTTKMDTE
ncbi:beta-glucosidase [Lysinibacter cavernae]|uniref:Beta-glucosidase n=1 Tax=Lysinibacter cavernae TaxID=1640652 RepID=A0A7X5R444_9MICO|nr:glycoside hydrolase family 3 N-terminal domain-containing protein [Lysinibacter cavernae]NIH55303.1 beta-glucosidase [Lysinibacter cavernae]